MAALSPERALSAVRQVIDGAEGGASVTGKGGDDRRMHAGLMDGWAGEALLLDAAARLGVCSDDRVWHAVESAVAGAPELEVPGLFSGPTGVAWMLTVVGPRLGLDVDQILEEHDSQVGEMVRQAEEGACLDLVYGLVGLGVYFLNRLPNAQAATSLERIAEGALQRCHTHEDGSVSWRFELPHPENQHVSFVHQLGVAHGQMGMLMLLANVERLGLASAAVSEALDAGLGFVRSRMLDAHSHVKADWPPAAVMSWCHGVLGIAAAAGRVALLRDDEGLRVWALDLVSALTTERWLEAEMRDLSVCHGEAAVVMLLTSLGRVAGDDRFVEATAERLEHIAGELVKPSRPLFLRGVSATEIAPRPSKGLLMGEAGAALTLLMGLTGGCPAWTRLFLP